jgi:hypothetical protein
MYRLFTSLVLTHKLPLASRSAREEVHPPLLYFSKGGEPVDITENRVSEATRSSLRGWKIKIFSGGAFPQSPQVNKHITNDKTLKVSSPPLILQLLRLPPPLTKILNETLAFITDGVDICMSYDHWFSGTGSIDTDYIYM